MAITSGNYHVRAIRDVTQAVHEKCEVLQRMLRDAQARLRPIEDAAHASVFTHIPLVAEMDRVFQQLHAIKVDPAMVGGETDKTLFDFVDADTVKSLQHEALEQTKELEEVLATHRHAITRIAAIHRYFTTLQARYKEQVDRLPMEASSGDDGNGPELEELYDQLVRCFVDMEQCDRSLMQYFATINEILPHYQELLADCQTLFEELQSLRDFYHHFSASYRKLGPELDRRTAYEKKVAKVIREAAAKMKALEEEETHIRVQFCEEYARYLPSSLCPQIKYLPDQFEIVRVENDDGSEPPLSSN